MLQGGTGRYLDETSVSSFLIRRAADVELFEGFQHNWVFLIHALSFYTLFPVCMPFPAPPCLHEHLLTLLSSPGALETSGVF